MTDQDAVESDRARPGNYRWRWGALALVCLAMFMAVLDSTSVYAALPVIAADLDFSAASIQWVITSYGVAVGGLLLFGGRLADIAGRRRVFMASLVLFAGASLMCGLAWSSGALIGARVAQGVGAAVMTPAGLAILMTIFPDGPDRNRALGIWGGLGGIGATVGLLLGGVLTDLAGWSWIFYTNVPVCAAVLVLSPVVLPAIRGHGRSTFDVAGAVTASGALVLLLLALFRVAEAGWVAGSTLLLLGAVALAALFVVIELRSTAPLVPMRIFRSRILVGGNLVIILAGIAVDGLLIVITLYAQQVLGYSAIQFGLTMAVMTATSVVAVLAGQHLVGRLGLRAVAVTGTAVLAVACLLLTRISPSGAFVTDLLAGLLLFGAGMGAAFVAGQIAALTRVAEKESGLAAGVAETSFAVGTTMGAALAAAVAVTHTAPLLTAGVAAPQALTEGFRVALAVLAAVATLGAVVAWVLLRPARSAGRDIGGSVG